MSDVSDIQLIWALFEGTSDLIHSIRPDGSFEFVNRAWLETLKYDEREVEHLKLQDIIYAESVRHYEEVLSSIMTGEKVRGLEASFRAKDGQRVFVRGNLFPRVHNGEVVAAQGFYQDVTQLHIANARLEDERARVEFFMDILTHDLTNIVQEVISVLDLLTYLSNLPSDMQTLIEEGLKEVERAAGLISNMKKLAVLKSRATEIKLQDLAEVISAAALRIDSEFTEKNLKVTLDVKPGQFLIEADEYLIEVFAALLHNAMKFDERKDVNVVVLTQALPHTPFVKIEVTDRGCGIPDMDKEDVFVRPAHRRDSILGLGLGLTLVKELMENYGGTIRVEDRVEGNHHEGSNFVMMLRHRAVDPDSQEGQ